MNMLKLSLTLIAILTFRSSIAQKEYSEFIDSSIRIDKFSQNDWAIGLAIEQWSNMIDESERDIILIISKIQDTFYLQKFRRSCFIDKSCYYASKSIILPKDITINYTIDSINQAQNEYVYQYIYKFDTLGHTMYVHQGPGTHTPNYIMNFKTKSLDLYRPFDNISFTEKLFGEKNLNFPYNSTTFIYRVFLKFTKFLKEHKTIIPK